MKNRNGIKWDRNETILAFDLYCRTSFSKVSSNNPDIIELASLLGRTPGAVALKMHNLAHYDPELQKRNVIAMAHGSKLDEEIFNEFSEDWTGLSYQAQIIRARMKNTNVTDLIDLGDIDDIPPGQYKEQMMKARVGQYFFRMAVLNSYDNRCCVTGLNCSELLVSSHIKPWKVSDEQTERTNPCNGLCLNSLHDKAFDRGLITINKRYEIVVSRKIMEAEMDTETRQWFIGYNKREIYLPKRFFPGREFIEYHNDIVFQK